MASGRLFQVRGPAMANDLSPMMSVYAACGASHCQLISFLDVGRRLDDKTLRGTGYSEARPFVHQSCQLVSHPLLNR